MKKIGLIFLATLFTCNFTISAQNRVIEKNYEMKKEKCEEHGEKMKEKLSAKKRAGYMAVDLELTEAQRSKLEALFEKQDKQREEHQAEMKKLREKHMTKMDEQRKANDVEMEKILGVEKYKVLQEKRAERKNRFEKNKQKRIEFREIERPNEGSVERRIEKRIEIRKPHVNTQN